MPQHTAVSRASVSQQAEPKPRRFGTQPAHRLGLYWLRGLELNQRPDGYEPSALPTELPRFNGSSLKLLSLKPCKQESLNAR